MPRTAQEIIDHADELAARFEQAEPQDLRDAAALRVVQDAFLARATPDTKDTHGPRSEAMVG
jgi:hypothetical protein